MFFNMLAESGLLAKSPASSSQLRSLCSQLSGHAERIVPSGILDQVVRTFERCGNIRCLYSRFDLKELSRLLVQLFGVLCEESTKMISITGYHHAVWLSTALVWLLEDNVSNQSDLTRPVCKLFS